MVRTHSTRGRRKRGGGREEEGGDDDDIDLEYEEIYGVQINMSSMGTQLCVTGWGGGGGRGWGTGGRDAFGRNSHNVSRFV